MRESSLFAQPFDNRRLTLTGREASVAPRVFDNRAGTGGYGAFSVSTNDVLVFLRSIPPARLITWYNREGKVAGSAGERDDYRWPALSPDGTRLAVSRTTGQVTNIWLFDLAHGGAARRFTFGSAKDSNPVWSPDGSQIIFSSNRDGPYNLYQKEVSGLKDEVVLLRSAEDKRPTSWSRDGRFLLYTVVQAGRMGRHEIWVLPLDGNNQPVDFVGNELFAQGARFSPDGHWVAYNAWEPGDTSGQYQVYARAFSMPPAGTAFVPGAKWQISTGFGTEPHWGANDRELYYCTNDGKLMAVGIATSPAFRAGKPQPVAPFFDLKDVGPRGIWDSLWDISADGQRIVAAASPIRRPEQYTVVMNWQEGLK